MLARVAVAAVLGVGLAGLAGCGPGRLDVKKTLTLDPGDTKSIDLKEQSAPQSISVTFEAKAGEVDVFVFDAKDAADLGDSLPRGKALGSQTKAKSGAVTATLPAKTAGRVVVTGAAKKTDVDLHVTNQK